MYMDKSIPLDHMVCICSIGPIRKIFKVSRIEVNAKIYVTFSPLYPGGPWYPGGP